MTNSIQSPRTSLDEVTTRGHRSNGPLRAFVTDPITTTKPHLSIDRNDSKVTTTSSKSNTSVLVRFGSIKQQDLLKYPSLTTTNTSTPTRSNKTREISKKRTSSADKFRRMVLECREMSS